MRQQGVRTVGGWKYAPASQTRQSKSRKDFYMVAQLPDPANPVWIANVAKGFRTHAPIVEEGGRFATAAQGRDACKYHEEHGVWLEAMTTNDSEGEG